MLIANVLDAFDQIDPARIISKAKLHVLVHLPEDIERFGPAIRFATEVFECFNHIFRMCSVLSNHQAPGRDIAKKCASLERMKHVLSGGYWLTPGGRLGTGFSTHTEDPQSSSHHSNAYRMGATCTKQTRYF